jgi:DNA-binding GntR family transcriptional regulator
MRRSPAGSKQNRDHRQTSFAADEMAPLTALRRHGPLGAAPRLYERLYEILASQIAEGERPPGAHIGESSVAAQFGVSRAPVRQALAELARNGLIEKAAGRGYAVRPVKGGRGGGTPDAAPMPPPDLRLVSLASWEPIYMAVESEIAARIPFGNWRLNEAVLARHYHVSRTVARDVAGRLQQRGILRKDERSRWYAPALTPEHVRELYEMRCLLEPVALTKAAANVPGAVIARMRANLEEAIANAHAIEGGTLDRLETEMHIDLLGYCGNQTLMQAIALPQSLLIAHRFLYKWTPRLFETEPFLPEHLDIVLKLEKGRTAMAARLLHAHLLGSEERAIERIRFIVRKFQPDELSYLTLLAAG